MNQLKTLYCALAGEKCNWSQVRQSLLDLEAVYDYVTEDEPAKSQEIEDLLLKVIYFQDELNVDEDMNHMPHSKSPEDMLKFYAIQVLHEISGNKYKSEMDALKSVLKPSVSCAINALYR